MENGITGNSEVRSSNVWVGLLVSILLWFGVLAIGGWLTSLTVENWYPQIAKPEWNPPSWVFAPVWSMLYLLLAIAGWRIWRRSGFSGTPWALRLYFLQMLLNIAWSATFFAAQNIGGGLIVLLLLWGTAIPLLISFWKSERYAGILLAPYFLWISFALALNFRIWQLNS